MADTIVFYHGNCLDGFGAAFAAWKHFGDEAEYIPVNYDDNLHRPWTETYNNQEDIWLVDFSFSNDVIQTFSENGHKVTILDHHKTALERLQPLMEEGLISGELDMSRSGAVITWQWFLQDPVPRLLKNVQDRDLWKFEKFGTEEICAALYAGGLEHRLFNVWNLYIHPDYHFDMWDALYDKGLGIIAAKNQVVEKVRQKAQGIHFLGSWVYVVNSTIYPSEIGNRLSEGMPFAVVYAHVGGRTRFSLRSKEGGRDVSKLAEKFGGGGHKHAAGFTLPYLYAGESL